MIRLDLKSTRSRPADTYSTVKYMDVYSGAEGDHRMLVSELMKYVCIGNGA